MKKVPHAEAIGKLSQPKGMRGDTWRRMKAFLRLLSSYGDDIFPTQRTLAKRLGTSHQVVQQMAVRAEKEGWIERFIRPYEGSWRPGTTYKLKLPDPVTRQGSQARNLPKYVLPTEVPGSSSSRTMRGLAPAKTPGPKNTSLPKANRYSGICYVCGQPIRAREGFLHGPLPVHRHCVTTERVDKRWQRQQAEDLDGVPALGEDPEAPLPVYGSQPTTPAARLALQFESTWLHDVLPMYPAWRKHRCMHVGAAIGYINNQFLRKGYSPAYVEAYFDAFFTELTYPSSSLELREGQQPWQLFTGWWGSTEVEDPAIEREAQQARDAVHDILMDESARRAAAQKRILAADEPDPEDWKIVRGRG